MGRGSEQNVELLEGLWAVRLSRLIEMKIACGSSNLRRTHKDFADVVELIAIRDLYGAFARYLRKSLRSTFRELVRNAAEPDDGGPTIEAGTRASEGEGTKNEREQVL